MVGSDKSAELRLLHKFLVTNIARVVLTSKFNDQDLWTKFVS